MPNTTSTTVVYDLVEKALLRHGRFREAERATDGSCRSVVEYLADQSATTITGKPISGSDFRMWKKTNRGLSADQHALLDTMVAMLRGKGE